MTAYFAGHRSRVVLPKFYKRQLTYTWEMDHPEANVSVSSYLLWELIERLDVRQVLIFWTLHVFPQWDISLNTNSRVAHRGHSREITHRSSVVTPTSHKTHYSLKPTGLRSHSTTTTVRCGYVRGLIVAVVVLVVRGYKPKPALL